MGYYKVEELSQGVYSLFEMVGVGSHLIVGDESALLIDTGYGFGNLRSEVLRITRKPLTIVNTHVHADHVRGNSQFEIVYAHELDMPDFTSGALDRQYEQLTKYGAKLYPALRLVLLYGKLKRKPAYTTERRLLQMDRELDLGGRAIRFIHVPGHTKGSIVALDSKSGTVFAGDAVNPGAFLFFDPTLRLADYADRLDVLAAEEGYCRLCISHQTAALPFSFIGWYADFLRRTDTEKSVQTDIPNDGRAVYRYTEESDDYGECSVFFDMKNVQPSNGG